MKNNAVKHHFDQNKKTGGKKEIVSQFISVSEDGVLIQYSCEKKDDTYTIPSYVTSIGSKAFYGCTSLKSITISDSVTTIDDASNSFYECSSLTHIFVDNDNKFFSSVDGVLFNKDGTNLILYPFGKKDKIYNIPSGVKIIGDRAFRRCVNLTNVTILSSVKIIGDNAFNHCKSLKIIYIPYSVEKIGRRAFSDCTSLIKITIPSSLTNIGDKAFYNCNSMRTFISDESKLITIGYGAFSGCRNLKIPRNRIIQE